VLPRRAIASNLDALADAWEWTADDIVAHGLPLFHVHGLVIGVLGPIRRGGRRITSGASPRRASPRRSAQGATMVFGVPTMYHRLVADAEEDSALARPSAGRGCSSRARPRCRPSTRAHRAPQRPAHRRALRDERDLMNTSIRADGDRRPGYVGPPLDGVEIRLLDDDGAPVDAADDETIGEIAVRGPNLFLEYLNRPDATAEALRDGWFRTGDLATRAPTATSASSGAAPPISSRAAASRSGRARSRARCSSTPACARRRSPASPTPTSASGSSPGSCPPRCRAVGRRAGRPCRLAADASQAPAGGAPARRAAAQRDGQGPEAAPQRVALTRLVTCAGSPVVACAGDLDVDRQRAGRAAP
jgi:hypothetical protein